ncbi:MAG TPA: rhomboid family intramembrane serine protease [Longimicrobiales bacterium]|nr:rhomboid family intramembrane serine protease [Longimicrobiales bacterium]
MFPLGDDNPTRSFAWVTVLIIVACTGVWVLVQGAGLDPDSLQRSVCALGAIPAEVTGSASAGAGCGRGGLTWQALFTSMFLHGGWFHLVGNMWFLWVFGNNIEDAMGPGRFVIFYLVSGTLAALAHVLTDPTSTLPMVGASGAISGIMGAYLVLYPRARVHTLFFFLIFFRVIPLPAWVILGYWFVLQLLSSGSGAGAGVAYAAHVGGFLAGILLVGLFVRRRPRSAGGEVVGVAAGEPRDRGW